MKDVNRMLTELDSLPSLTLGGELLYAGRPCADMERFFIAALRTHTY